MMITYLQSRITATRRIASHTKSLQHTHQHHKIAIVAHCASNGNKELIGDPSGDDPSYAPRMLVGPQRPWEENHPPKQPCER
eukprot:5796515-Amphidinium_carterae.2